MSAVEMLQLKQQLSKLSAKDREEAAAFLLRLKQDTAPWRKEMSRRMDEMDAGKGVRLKKPLARG